MQFGDPKLPERFWKKVEPNESGCWIWIGAIKNQRGGRQYATYTHEGRQRQVLMVVALVAIQPGYDTQEFRAENTCENKYICANPDHIKLVSRFDCKRGHKNPPRQHGSCKICKREDEKARPWDPTRRKGGVKKRKPKAKPVEGFTVFGDKDQPREIWRPSGWPKEVLGGRINKAS